MSKDSGSSFHDKLFKVHFHIIIQDAVYHEGIGVDNFYDFHSFWCSCVDFSMTTIYSYCKLYCNMCPVYL